MRSIIWGICILFCAVSLWAGPPSSLSETKVDSLQRLLDRLQMRLESLETAQVQAKQDEALQKLMNQAKILSQKKKEESFETKTFHGGLQQQSILNPNLSVGGDFNLMVEHLHHPDSKSSKNQGRFTLKEMEIGVESYLDPYSRGKVFLSIGPEGVEVEEGYAEWFNFPLNMNLKIGEFKTQFGQLNRYHDHALPQFDRPLVLSTFFGECGLKGTGMSGNFLLPRLWAHVNDLDVGFVSIHDQPLFADDQKTNFVFVTHLKNYYDLNRSTYLELGLSAASGKGHPEMNTRTVVGSADLTLKWTPPDRSKYRGWEWRTECLVSHLEGPGDPIDAWGAFSSLQVRMGARTLMSGRIDYTELPEQPDQTEKGFALNLDYWQSEFVFFRLQYSYIQTSTNEDDHRFILQTNWAMGPHKHEAY